MDGAVDFTHLLFFVYAEYRLLIGVTQNVNEEHHVSAKITVCLFRYRHIFIISTRFHHFLPTQPGFT